MTGPEPLRVTGPGAKAAATGSTATSPQGRDAGILNAMATVKSPLRAQFEAERRRSAILGFLPGMGAGVIAADTWLSPLAGVPGGVAAGGAAFAVIWAYETFMWRKHHG